MDRIATAARIFTCATLGLGAWMTQVPPNDAVINACKWFAVYGKDCPAWLNASNIPAWTPAALSMGALVTVIWMIWPYATRMRARRLPRAAQPSDEFIPMREAAARAYEALRATPWAEFADLPGAPGDSPESRRILYMANALKVPLYGKKPLSSQYDEINETDRPLIENGETFSYRTSNSEYMDVAVKSGDLKIAIEKMQVT